jgi:glutathione S-transferase
MITLYSGPLSLFSRKVEIALREKGLAFDRIMVPFTQERGYAPKHPAVSAANPKGQVPVLFDGDLTVFDSTVIFEYLEDAYPSPPLYPRHAADRARCRMLELAADEILLPQVAKLMYRTVPPHPDASIQQARITEGERGEAAIRARYDALETALAGGDYLCGIFSVADIATFMTVLFALRLKGPGLSQHPALSAWYARVGGRPSAGLAAREIAAADRALSPRL